MKSIAKSVSFELFPAFSRRVRRVFYTPLGVLSAGFLIAVLCGLAIHPRVFALAGGLGGVMVIGLCWPWLTLQGCSAELQFDCDRATEGDHIRVSFEIANHFLLPVWGLNVRGGFEETDDSFVRLESAPSRSRSTCRWNFSPSVRGIYPVSPPFLSNGFPFGIWHSSKRVRVERVLIVWPITFPVGPVPTKNESHVVDGMVAKNRAGNTGDVLGVRPYRRGDSPRRIHWAQSAKHDRLIVCELATNTRPIVLLLLDTDPANHTLGINGTFEWAIRTTASFAKGWIDAGAQVGLVIGSTLLPPASGPGQLIRLMDRLASVTKLDAIPFSSLLQSKRVTSSRSAVSIAITTDARMSAASSGDTIRYVALRRSGFGGLFSDKSSGSKAWLEINDADDVPRQLRFGWAEARHGS